MRELIKNSTVYLRGTSETHCISMCLHYDETGTGRGYSHPSKQLINMDNKNALV